jgi:hypothetical protein
LKDHAGKASTKPEPEGCIPRSVGVAGSAFWQQGACRPGAGSDRGSSGSLQQQQALAGAAAKRRKQQTWGGTSKAAKATKAHTLFQIRVMEKTPGRTKATP